MQGGLLVSLAELLERLVSLTAGPRCRDMLSHSARCAGHSSSRPRIR